MKWTQDRDGNVEVDGKPTVGDIIRGAVGVARAATGLGAASQTDYQARWAICMACDQHDAGRCRTCGCFTGAKVRVARESCPAGKWVAVEAVTTGGQPCCGKRGNLDNTVSGL
jgi:hypothetical protein